MVQQWFKRLLIALGTVSTVTVLLIITMLLFVQEDSSLFEFLKFVLGSLVCFVPVLLFGIAATGLDILLKGKQKKKQNPEFIYELDNNIRLQYIMNKLSSEERDYLEIHLAERKFGLGDDGEMISIEDLLSEFEGKSKQD